MMDFIKDMEVQLLQLLSDNDPADKRPAGSGACSMARRPAGHPDAVRGQDQVDDLLASLGF